MRAHREIAERRGHDKSFSVMHDEGIEKSALAFHDGFLTLDEIQDIYRAAGEMQDAAAKPVAACLDEFELVQAGAFFAPPGPRGDGFDSIDEILAHPLGCAVPLNIAKAMIEMDRPRRTVEAEAGPIPHFKSENVRRGADFKNHAVASRTMNGARGNQEVLVFFRRPFIDVALDVKIGSPFCATRRSRASAF